MNRQYLEYSPEVGAPTANSHHGQQHRLQKQPECKAANLSENHNAENLFSLGGPCRRFTVCSTEADSSFVSFHSSGLCTQLGAVQVLMHSSKANAHVPSRPGHSSCATHEVGRFP